MRVVSFRGRDTHRRLLAALSSVLAALSSVSAVLEVP